MTHTVTMADDACGVDDAVPAAVSAAFDAEAVRVRTRRVGPTLRRTLRHTTRLGHHCASAVGLGAIAAALALWLQPTWRDAALGAVLAQVAPGYAAGSEHGDDPQAAVAPLSASLAAGGKAALAAAAQVGVAAPVGAGDAFTLNEKLASSDGGGVMVVAARGDAGLMGSSRAQERVVDYIATRYHVASPPIRRLVDAAFATGKNLDIDPLLLLAVMAVESSFNPYAQSGVGAQGLMQVMATVHSDKFAHFGGSDAALEPFANLQVGTVVLRDCIARRGSLAGGLNCYVGSTTADDGGYGAKVLAERERLRVAARRGGAAVRTIVAHAKPAQPKPPAALAQAQAKDDSQGGIEPAVERQSAHRATGMLDDHGAPVARGVDAGSQSASMTLG
ncbi:transglycosylase SLT domain-containing protein [Chitinasiproducens palmae]|uniref:Soluble lytic murein transglycosylase n=1 Tax=Chitinasiproducens palmae TaxID=1770053 RepID=A0A1H2PMH6_9BURK|nr:transglycosylase SLT domain-containing protein [Chitinasiproducens palmae]SDV47758.1 Soluble lytic murein transglycosylase [Chitinasiproducens palmae]